MASMSSPYAELGQVCTSHTWSHDYNTDVDQIRRDEYPMLEGTTYLDHAGTTLYARSLIDDFSQQMLSNIYGNPHSASSASQLSTRRIDDIRTRALRFFNADPDHFDLVFVANATAGIKLVVDALREQPGGFWYGYHRDAHTSLVGAREVAAAGHRCFQSDAEVEDWMQLKNGEHGDCPSPETTALFAYPAQSNMNGRRLVTNWPGRLRASAHRHTWKAYSLLDAAALVSTTPLNLGDVQEAPDFTVLSFYKIFGFPDLGALIIRKESGSILTGRRYFGGGTVEMVASGRETWHMSKQSTLHDQLEDGTLPIHSILALNSAFDVHARLFGSMDKIARHTGYLMRLLTKKLKALRHYNRRNLCEIYQETSAIGREDELQGPIIAFNLRNSEGQYISNTEVEKLANIRKIQLRSGGLCNPGGIAFSLDLAPWELKRNFSAGQRCGNEHDIMEGKPSGMLRISLGAVSNTQDVEVFVSFLEDFFLERAANTSSPSHQPLDESAFYVESLTVYPVKSCGGWSVPKTTPWTVRPEGLAWDREWCLVHEGTRKALSQKRHPRMAMIKPSLDLSKGLLRIRYDGVESLQIPAEVSVPLSADPSVFKQHSTDLPSHVCGDPVAAQLYSSSTLSHFFTTILDTPCTLARFPSPSCAGHCVTPASTRHSKPHITEERRPALSGRNSLPSLPLLLSNESPILVVSRSSVNRLNEHIKRGNSKGKTAHASVFRANIVVAEMSPMSGRERPYAEDQWTRLCIRRRSREQLVSKSSSDDTAGSDSKPSAESGNREGSLWLDVLGGCRRCQMVCIDQTTAAKDEEPFVTLAKTRRRPGKGVFFGVHAALSRPPGGNDDVLHADDYVDHTNGIGNRNQSNIVAVGDRVWPTSGKGACAETESG